MEITMPQLGETVTEGTITKWLKRVGDRVEHDELLFEVSTDKVDSEVPSASAGVLAEILVPEGDTVAVGTVLAIVTEGEGAAAAPPPASAPAPVPAPAPPPPPAPEPAPVPAPAPAPADGEAQSHRTGLVLSPVVRRLLEEHRIDPAQIAGTGTGGRVTRSDVLAYIDRSGDKGTAPAPAPSAPPVQPAAAPAPASPAAAPGAGLLGPAVAEVIPFDNIRRRVAEHMVRSKAVSPHVLTTIEVDYENVERVRQAHRETWRAREGFGLTYLPFIARAVCDALGEFPRLNASVVDNALHVHGQVNLGIAVDLDFEGLIVPVVHEAGGKRLRQLAREIRDLAERARAHKLTPDDVSGGTYTITNPGPYGTMLSAPIINQPQVAILSTEGVRKRPVVVESPEGDAIAIHHTGVLAQSFDHRGVDGAYSAAFLARLREILETRDWDAELT